MDRNSRACVSLLVVLVGVLLALVGPVAGGTTKATFAAGVGPTGDAALLRRLMSARLEDGVSPELLVDVELHRRVLAGAITTDALKPGRPACIRSCPAPGRPYTDRGCEAVYQCPH
ncbi:hypothetical protein HU200_056597 [Digitaria exilis]|uniref:Uncharacterized protein n=1 Tax=Digitaria exilis TaxID=1010633 RepID=A0A835ACM1_9POAL|nr:hypothetical protein HU200_056597 [Digitaria exilis]